MSKTLTPERFLNNSHFVSSDFIEIDSATVGANMNEIFAFAEAYHKAKVEQFIDSRIEDVEENQFACKISQKERLLEMKLIKRKLLQQ